MRVYNPDDNDDMRELLTKIFMLIKKNHNNDQPLADFTIAVLINSLSCLVRSIALQKKENAKKLIEEVCKDIYDSYLFNISKENQS